MTIGMRMGGWRSLLFVAALFLLCVAASELWRNDSSAPSPVNQATSVAPHTSDPSGSLANDACPIELPVVSIQRTAEFDLGQYATGRSVAVTAPPVTSFVPCAPAIDDFPRSERRGPEPISVSRRAIESVEMTPERRVAAMILPRAGGEAIADGRAAWPLPQALLDELDPLGQQKATAAWTENVRAELLRLHHCNSLSDAAAHEALKNLDRLVAQARELLDQVSVPRGRVDLQRAAYSLQRRVVVWTLAAEASRGMTAIALSDSAPKGLDQVVMAVDKRVARLPQAAAWQEYLRMGELRTLAITAAADAAGTRDVAADVLLRMNASSLSREQVALMQESEFQELATVLRRWTTEPVDYRQLIGELEQYERQPTATSAAVVAEAIERLRWSGPPASTLAELLETHYRNANARVAVSDEMLNRWLPKREDIHEPVRQQILGARVRGRSRATSELRVELIPDPHQWQVGLQVAGNVRSATESSKGPATFYNQGDAHYAARKLLLVDRHGIRVSPAEAQARSDARLTDMATDFDTLPVINAIVRGFALQEYEGKAPQARRQMNNLVAGRASQRMDQEVHDKLGEAEQQFRQYVLEPFTRMYLNPTALNMETTETRLIARYRVAGTDQLAAHTPRPQAPSDSLLSIQLHESAMNNIIQGLGLAGKQTDLPTLFRDIVTIFNRPDLDPPPDLPDDVIIRFENVDPIHLQFAQGEIAMTLRIAELQAPDRHWKNFVVRAAYRPRFDGLRAALHRDEYVQIAGPELGFREKLPLRAVFSTVLAKERPIQLLGEQFAERAEFEQLQVSQFVIQDGWIGLAIGPAWAPDRTARPASPKAARR